MEVENTSVAAERVRVTRVAVTLRDDALATNRLHGVGFRAVSTGGWRGPVRVVRQDAVADMYEYRAEHPRAAHQGEDVSPTGRAEAS
jgi:hypothetical protein